MSNISLSSSVRSALSSIQSSQAAAAIQQTRLATGKKVNSAIDNPANFFTASGLNNRASDLNRLLDGIGLGIKTVEAADKGIKAITKLVETAQGAARQALQNASTNLSSTGTALAGGATKVAAGPDAGAFSVTAGSTTTSVTVAAGDTVQKVVDALNVEGTGVRAEVGTDNKLKISALNGEALSIDAASTDATSAFLGQTEGAVARTTATTNTTRKDLAKQFDELRTQIDQLAKDSGFNGLNLLNGDSIKLQYNESNTSSQTVKGVTFDSTGLGIAASTNSLQSDSSINAGLANLEKAVTSLRSQASAFGSNLAVAQNRQDFTKGLIDTLQTGADGLVLADANEEGAKLLSLNTRSQLGNTALSLASQAEQGVLRLF
ncbi:MAG: flagellin hook IN motif-containing protein [Bosea sp. (in: a-proteobacteria)]